MHTNPLITMEDLLVRLRGRPVLNGISWEINVGEQWAILGPNGAGKSTLVKTIAGMLPLAGGNITFHTADRHKRNVPLKEIIGFVSAEMHRHVFEREAFAEEMRHFSGDESRCVSGADFILDRSENGRESFPARIAELQALSEKVSLQGLLEKSIGVLTTGEISKMLILKALFKKPQLLILDEPFNGLGRRSKETLAKLIGGLIQTGLQVILITHRVEEIIPEISHVLLLNAEGIQEAGLKKEVLQPTSIRRVFRTGHDPLNQEMLLGIRPAAQMASQILSHNGPVETPVGTKLVEMIDVMVQYHQKMVLEHVHWTIRTGENWLVYGPDGAGKTSLLNLVSGENLQAYANEIYLFGKKKGSGESVWEIKEKIGWITSDLQSKYPLNIKGEEVVYSGFFDSMGLYRTASDAQRQQAAEWLGALGITHLAQETYGNLSHGQKQILLIARAMVKFPRLLLLDEPCEGLDFANRRKILEIIEFIGRHTPTTLVYATCDDSDILPCITHQLRLDNGSTTISM